MADKSEKVCAENHDTSAKTHELLTHLSSTVFACDISGDTRYIRCDFPRCRQHAEALQGKPCWILNTLRNVRFLENHVGKEVHHYMKEVDSGMCDQVPNVHYVESQHWIEAQALPQGTRKVLAVFNLKDPQSQFGDWISLFLNAAFMAEGLQQHGCVVITQNFVSRYELMECIAKLHFLCSHQPTVEVVAVLSCHSSCQGQVFSCTPFAMGKQCEFEEFCSLHDFVMACHNVLNSVLVAVHVSSCFTLKLDCSHVDWPVDASWLKNKLQCVLSGSTREVYETGSQVADLHLMLSTMLPSLTAGTCGTLLRTAVLRACEGGFPDLAREMGLQVLTPDSVNDKLSREGRDDEVTPPGLVMSSVRVVLLVQAEDSGLSPKAPFHAVHRGSYIALADALTANLQIRKASDVKCEYTVIQVKHNEINICKESLKKHLSLLPLDTIKVLFVAIGPMFSRPNLELIDIIEDWSSQKNDGICYGIHFQHITAMQAYAIKNRLRQIQGHDTTISSSEGVPSKKHLSVTGLVDNGDKNCPASFPVLLYMIHLAVGENGNRLAGKGIPSAVYSNKPVGHGVSSWTLEEVYMETSHVLSGLSRKCGLHLLSPTSSPERTPLATSPRLSGACTIPSDKTILETSASPSSSDFKRAESGGEMDSVVITSVFGNSRETMEVRNEPVQREDAVTSIENCNDKPKAGSESVRALFDQKANSVVRLASGDVNVPFWNKNNSECENKPSFGNEPSHAAVLTEEISQERNNDSGVFSCDSKLPAANEESDLVTFCKKPLGTNVVVADKEKRSIPDEPVGVAGVQTEPLPAGDFLRDASLGEEERTASLVGEHPSQIISHDLKERCDTKLVHERPEERGLWSTSSTTTPVLKDSVKLLRHGEDPSCLKDNAGIEAGIEEEQVDFSNLSNESANTGSFLEVKSSTKNKESAMKPDQNDHERDENRSPKACITKMLLTIGQSVSEAGESSAPVNDTERWPTTGSATQISSTSESTGATTSLQIFIRDFRSYCKKLHSFKATKNSQGPPSKRRKKSPQKGPKEKSSVSGNLESKNKCLGVSKGSARFSEVSATTARSSALDLNLESESNEQIATLSSMESGPEATSVSKTPDDLVENTNDLKSADNGSQKRPLSLDYSCDISDRISVKKPRYKPECEFKGGKTVEESTCSTRNDWNKSEDLPLMANVDEVLVNHYILDLTVEFSQQIMKGSIVLFIEPRNEEVTRRQFQMTLDSTLVNIESVNEVVLPEGFKLAFNSQQESRPFSKKPSSNFLADILGHNTRTPLPYKGLPYSVYGWFVQIWKPNATGKAWPRCIWINYHTSPKGKSLTWATDQDGKPCVYSPGAYINNRSLMPCQEPPVAMSSWQASIHVPEGCVVLMSGNELVGITAAEDGQVTYLYEMETPLPCSTLAVAAGWWECRQPRDADTENGANSSVPVTCRMFAPSSVINRAADELLGYAPKFVEAACELLGPYPFRRLDMLILPKCFACMGLKSPNLAFLSQSLLSGDASMRVRLAHEISHAWFGLLVGAKDWSEEWLSEGFATFIEEKIQSKAEKWSQDKDRFYREMRQILRHRCLLFEIKECDDNLKCLRPKVVKPSRALSTAEAIERSAGQPDAVRPHTVVQFGQICSRKWTQVHYLKGYFLLHHLAMMVGLDEFNTFLFNYVQHYSGQLVSSEEFFEYFVQSFPDISSETKHRFITEWLERAGLPKSFPKKFDSPDNELVSQVEHEFQMWKKQDATNKRNKTLRIRKRSKPPTSTLEIPEQVVLFMEKLLERDTISHNTLRQLDKCYNFSHANAEVRHRWCELVVKHNYTPGLKEVKRFLVEDQGMGIYLFGELIISQQPKQRALVDEVLEEIGGEMDRCTYQTVKDMLEGND